MNRTNSSGHSYCKSEDIGTMVCPVSSHEDTGFDVGPTRFWYCIHAVFHCYFSILPFCKEQVNLS